MFRCSTHVKIIIKLRNGPDVIKLFFMLNSAEYEIVYANKSQITNNVKLFLAKHS